MKVYCVVFIDADEWPTSYQTSDWWWSKENRTAGIERLALTFNKCRALRFDVDINPKLWVCGRLRDDEAAMEEITEIVLETSWKLALRRGGNHTEDKTVSTPR